MGKQAKFLTVEQFVAIAQLNRPAVAAAIRNRRFPVAMDERRGRLLIEAAPALAWAHEVGKARPGTR